MNKTELTRAVKEMIAAPSCCQELKAAGQNYLNALGTDAEKAAAAALLQEIREDVCTLDQTIPFFESELGAQIFGAERAEAMAAHAREIKEQGKRPVSYMSASKSSRVPGELEKLCGKRRPIGRQQGFGLICRS